MTVVFATETTRTRTSAIFVSETERVASDVMVFQDQDWLMITAVCVEEMTLDAAVTLQVQFVMNAVLVTETFEDVYVTLDGQGDAVKYLSLIVMMLPAKLL
jgi:hypothetical protein